MYRLGSIERRLVRDDAELGYEFGDGYEWMDWKCTQGFGDKSTFNGDISKWDTGKVTDMNHMFYSLCVQPRHWELEHSASDSYKWNVC